MELNDYFDEIRGKRALVLGGLGFVGRNLVNTLVNDFGCLVICLDNRVNSISENHLKIEESVTVLYEDVRNLNKWKHLLFEVDYVFHLACIQIAHSAKQPIEDLDVNARSVLEILELIKTERIYNIQRFIYTSSCSVYGYSSKLPITETDPINPLSHYASTKYLGERYTMLYNQMYSIPTATVRYSNVYGYGQTPQNPYCGVLGKFIHQALNNIPVTVVGDGEQTRDYTFISDAVCATILCSTHPKAIGNVFNIATTIETSINSIVQSLRQFKPDLEVQRIPDRDIDNIRRRVIDFEKIRQTLGWAPLITLNEGLEKTINWYQNSLHDV